MNNRIVLLFTIVLAATVVIGNSSHESKSVFADSGSECEGSFQGPYASPPIHCEPILCGTNCVESPDSAFSPTRYECTCNGETKGPATVRHSW